MNHRTFLFASTYTMAVARNKQRKDQKKAKQKPAKNKEVSATATSSKANERTNSKADKAAHANTAKKPKPIPAYRAAKLARAAAAVARASPDPLAGPVDIDLAEDHTLPPSPAVPATSESTTRRSTRSKASTKANTPSSASEEEIPHDINEVIWRQGGGDRLDAADTQELGMDASNEEEDSDEVIEVAPEVMRRVLLSADEDEEAEEQGSGRDEDEDDDDDDGDDEGTSVTAYIGQMDSCSPVHQTSQSIFLFLYSLAAHIPPFKCPLLPHGQHFARKWLNSPIPLYKSSTYPSSIRPMLSRSPENVSTSIPSLECWLRRRRGWWKRLRMIIRGRRGRTRRRNSR